MDPLELVRSTCARVARRARHVIIVEPRLAPYAAELAASPAPTIDDPAHRRHGDTEATAAYVLALDAVNFGSAWFPDLRGANEGGYLLVAQALETAEPITARWMAAVTPASMATLLGQEGNAAVAPFVTEVAGGLADLGRLLLDRYDGSATAFVDAAGGSAARLVAQLGALPRYRDTARYDDQPVWLLKRAQLTAADLTAALGPTFGDLDRLTVFADDLVPHVLRTDGVLRYDDDLAIIIDSGTELAPGSPWEVEVRAATVHAGELLRTVLGWTAPELDWRLWARGQDARYADGATRRHRTRTTFY